MLFDYTKEDLFAIAKKDPKLGVFIDHIGFIKREAFDDFTKGFVYTIIGQQISSKAQNTVYKKLRNLLGDITIDNILNADLASIRRCGISPRKVKYIFNYINKVKDGSLNLKALESMSYKELLATLSQLDGVGPWTVEMLMLFTLKRADILSFGDLGIKKGMCIVYNKKKIDKKTFTKIKNNLSPYGSIASLYFWEIAARY